MGPLLKAYQEEVDRLTSRAKSGEASFLEWYQRLYEAPDPAPALASGLVRAPAARRPLNVLRQQAPLSLLLLPAWR